MTFPGMEEDVEEQERKAQALSGQQLSEEMRRPLGNISKAAGEMERESPLFHGKGDNPLLFPKRRRPL